MPKSRLVCSTLIILGALLTLVGYFSPWIPHQAAGLSITGFEMAEWIKFAPDVRNHTVALRRMDFYWPPVAAVIGLVALTTYHRKWRWYQWGLTIMALGLSLLPFPLFEEVNSLTGIKANWGRLGMVAYGLLAVGVSVWFKVWPAKFRGAGLTLISGLGLVLTSLALSAAEPIVEKLFNHLINPGLGYNLTRLGLILLMAAGGSLLFSQQKRGDVAS